MPDLHTFSFQREVYFHTHFMPRYRKVVYKRTDSNKTQMADPERNRYPFLIEDRNKEPKTELNIVTTF